MMIRTISLKNVVKFFFITHPFKTMFGKLNKLNFVAIPFEYDVTKKGN